MIRSAILIALSASIFSHSSIAWTDKQCGSGVCGSETGIAPDDAVQRAASNPSSLLRGVGPAQTHNMEGNDRWAPSKHL